MSNSNIIPVCIFILLYFFVTLIFNNKTTLFNVFIVTFKIKWWFLSKYLQKKRPAGKKSRQAICKKTIINYINQRLIVTCLVTSLLPSVVTRTK